MRVLLFTDTLADVNGVSRFIRNMAEQALELGRDLTVVTSTVLRCPPLSNIVNLSPRFSRPMPGYPNLEVVTPPFRRAADLIRRSRPDAVHVSTPGPVGYAAMRAARRAATPLLGTYHTDFPAYVSHLFQDEALTWLCARAMRSFYAPFRVVFTRSEQYVPALGAIGVLPDRIERLVAGIDTRTFHTCHRPPDTDAFWRSFGGVRPGAVKALYVGRVSVEKNLPFLARVWKRALRVLSDRRPAGAPAPDAQLMIVGDGPNRARMEAEFSAGEAAFLGFRHGQELSRIYAASDLFLFPSVTDTLGQVVMEAQCAGLPVIVTDRGGPREVVSSAPGEHQSGLVLPAEDERQWADSIAELVLDDARRRRMGHAAHALIEPRSIRHSFEHFWSVHERAAQAGIHASAP